MERFLSVTSDGSSTLRLKNHNESYHSGGGAYQETLHIYIEAGLGCLLEQNSDYLYPDSNEAPQQAGRVPVHLPGPVAEPGAGQHVKQIAGPEKQHGPGSIAGAQEEQTSKPVPPQRAARPSEGKILKRIPEPAPDLNPADGFRQRGGAKEIGILDIGLGTALNCLLTALYAFPRKLPVFYHGIEKYPVTVQEIRQLNYPQYIGAAQPSVGIPVKMIKEWFEKIHAASWEQEGEIFPGFTLKKSRIPLEDFSGVRKYDLVYFDAFSPGTQPELWTEAIFKNIYNLMENKGILVTYCCKGTVKTALRKAGFTVKRLPGINGKRHILRAEKTPGTDSGDTAIR